MSSFKRLHSQARTRRRGKPGFTLLELIVVLLVLGILAAISVPTFQRVKENSVVRAVQTTLEAAARNGEAIAASDRDATDVEIAAAVESEFTDTAMLTVSVSGNTVTVTQTNGAVSATGSVEFNGGVATITNATAGAGGSVLTGFQAPTAISWQVRWDTGWGEYGLSGGVPGDSVNPEWSCLFCAVGENAVNVGGLTGWSFSTGGGWQSFDIAGIYDGVELVDGTSNPLYVAIQTAGIGGTFQLRAPNGEYSNVADIVGIT